MCLTTRAILHILAAPPVATSTAASQLASTAALVLGSYEAKRGVPFESRLRNQCLCHGCSCTATAVVEAAFGGRSFSSIFLFRRRSTTAAAAAEAEAAARAVAALYNIG